MICVRGANLSPYPPQKESNKANCHNMNLLATPLSSWETLNLKEEAHSALQISSTIIINLKSVFPTQQLHQLSPQCEFCYENHYYLTNRSIFITHAGEHGLRFRIFHSLLVGNIVDAMRFPTSTKIKVWIMIVRVIYTITTLFFFSYQPVEKNMMAWLESMVSGVPLKVSCI